KCARGCAFSRVECCKVSPTREKLIPLSNIILTEWNLARQGWCVKVNVKVKKIALGHRGILLMSCLRLLSVSGAVLCLSAPLLVLSACGGGAAGAPVTSVGPPASYTLAATALTPGSVIVGGTSTSTV